MSKTKTYLVESSLWQKITYGAVVRASSKRDAIRLVDEFAEQGGELECINDGQGSTRDSSEIATVIEDPDIYALPRIGFGKDEQ
ncbi:hypothetical protein OZX67_03900 [Bifidobacterium sp. ESL0728]|uniref:hypothetical protein n=1 Tax=Bifidobacterium sp. ESL0728 TaxID=2983220 RepID=UPI0023F827F0|nr:hypothetical protein [Bifidobacterium sp. ESL0728]WEV59691.1 hypothetical protein OZX67_03900 [Bifidobacterium sp. ESL0728]